jgi:hypothetical protein
MKRIILCLIVALISSVLPIAAQHTDSTGVTVEKAYQEWKAKQQAERPGAVMPPHFCFVALAWRTAPRNTNALFEFYVLGEMSGVKLQIQPLKVEKLPNGEYKQENAGDVTDHEFKPETEKSMSQTFSINFPVPFNADANAYAVKWSLEGSPLKGVHTIIGKIETPPVASVMGFLRD